MAVTNNIKDEYKYRLTLTKQEKRLTLNELVEKLKINELGSPIIIKDDFRYIVLEYYYNKDGKIEFYKPIGEIPLNKLKEYGINIDNEVEFTIIDAIGSTTGIRNLLDIYNSIELFLSTHPLLLIGVTSITTKKYLPKIKKLFIKLRDKCSVELFKKALYHKKEITVEEFVKAFEFKKNINEDDKIAVEIILECMGYKYNKKKKKWVLLQERDEKNGKNKK